MDEKKGGIEPPFFLTSNLTRNAIFNLKFNLPIRRFRAFLCARLRLENKRKNLETIAVSRFSFGGRYRTRTCDPLHVKQVL